LTSLSKIIHKYLKNRFFMNKYIKIFFVLFIASSLYSCDLDRFPRHQIVTDESFASIADAQNWDNGIFAMLRTCLYGDFTLTQDVMGDQLNAVMDYGNRRGWVHQWTPLNAGDGTLLSIWTAYYQGIRNANFIISSMPILVEYLEAGEGISEDNRRLLNRFLGNAHMARAFYYHQLTLRWGSEAFNPATAATALGVPLVKTFDITERPARATMQETYNFILEDITEARRLLATVAGTPRYHRFSIDAVNALDARVRLHMQDWASAFTAANNLIASNRFPLENTVEGLEQMWVHDNSDEVIMLMFVADPTERPGVGNDIYLSRQSAQPDRFRPDFLPSQWVVDMFDEDDIRRPVFFSNSGVLEIGGLLTPNIYRVQKFRGNPAFPGSGFGGAGNASATSNMQAPIVFRIAEMYLIAAETAFRSPTLTDADALAPLNALRTNRGLDALVGISGNTLFEEIQNERFRELAFEGFRFWDLRRWGLGFERRDPQNTDVLMSGPDFFTKSVLPNDPKFVWGIPSNDMRANPNLVQNPGW
jgi:hypothetical protein